MGRDLDAEFTAFVKARGRRLARTATLLAGDPVAGEDLLQTALAQTYVRWRKAPDIDELESYARVVLVRAQLTWRRRLASTEVVTSYDDLPVTGDSVPDLADRLVSREVLLAGLRALPPRQRTALVLRFFDDLSEADTASLMGCSAGSVKQHTSRGLARLRSTLGDRALA